MVLDESAFYIRLYLLRIFKELLQVANDRGKTKLLAVEKDKEFLQNKKKLHDVELDSGLGDYAMFGFRFDFGSDSVGFCAWTLPTSSSPPRTENSIYASLFYAHGSYSSLNKDGLLTDLHDWRRVMSDDEY
ncbi:hypothetical protein L2E82_16626 [Cichorium intybus]|uniref:Uncharacterized protein n=1 Tax=Cichorium intybus TaxID=13427 RepID=A0ACB9F625_CICIN|nr:hypothetical protein L2E82_16626 [Cichorium intybus]